MSDLYIELLVKKKKTSTDTLLKVLMIGATVIFVLGGVLFNPIILLLAVVMGVVDYFKLPSLDLEYEYLYVNGELDDESDDLIDDRQLYRYIVRLAALTEEHPPTGPDEAARWCQTAVSDFSEPVPGARDRVVRCLHVILTAYLAARLKREAEALLAELA